MYVCHMTALIFNVLYTEGYNTFLPVYREKLEPDVERDSLGLRVSCLCEQSDSIVMSTLLNEPSAQQIQRQKQIQ